MQDDDVLDTIDNGTDSAPKNAEDTQATPQNSHSVPELSSLVSPAIIQSATPQMRAFLAQVYDQILAIHQEREQLREALYLAEEDIKTDHMIWESEQQYQDAIVQTLQTQYDALQSANATEKTLHENIIETMQTQYDDLQHLNATEKALNENTIQAIQTEYQALAEAAILEKEQYETVISALEEKYHTLQQPPNPDESEETTESFEDILNTFRQACGEPSEHIEHEPEEHKTDSTETEEPEETSADSEDIPAEDDTDPEEQSWEYIEYSTSAQDSAEAEANSQQLALVAAQRKQGVMLLPEDYDPEHYSFPRQQRRAHTVNGFLLGITLCAIITLALFITLPRTIHVQPAPAIEQAAAPLPAALPEPTAEQKQQRLFQDISFLQAFNPQLPPAMGDESLSILDAVPTNPERLHARAMTLLQDMGDSGAPDVEQAQTLLTQAADLGHAQAAYQLAVLYHQGRWIDVNLDKAYEYYTLSAEQNDPYASYNVALLHLHEGSPFGYDPQLAKTMLTIAAEQNIMEAHYALGILYEHGALGMVALESAIAHYLIAKDAGYNPVNQPLAQLLEQLNMSEEEARNL